MHCVAQTLQLIMKLLHCKHTSLKTTNGNSSFIQLPCNIVGYVYTVCNVVFITQHATFILWLFAIFRDIYQKDDRRVISAFSLSSNSFDSRRHVSRIKLVDKPHDVTPTSSRTGNINKPQRRSRTRRSRTASVPITYLELLHSERSVPFSNVLAVSKLYLLLLSDSDRMESFNHSNHFTLELLYFDKIIYLKVHTNAFLDTNVGWNAINTKL